MDGWMDGWMLDDFQPFSVSKDLVFKSSNGNSQPFIIPDVSGFRFESCCMLISFPWF